MKNPSPDAEKYWRGRKGKSRGAVVIEMRYSAAGGCRIDVEEDKREDKDNGEEKGRACVS
jgi:hypothetical protein